MFPKLESVGAEVAGDGLTVAVRFSKTSGMPVRLVREGEGVTEEAAAIREVDLQKKFHWSTPDLAAKVDLTGPRFTALRRHLGLDDDPTCRHTFTFGSQKHPRYSDNALTQLREAIRTLDMDAVWRAHRPRPGNRPAPACTQPNCQEGRIAGTLAS